MVALAPAENPISFAFLDGANIYRTYIELLGDRTPRTEERFNYRAAAMYCEATLGAPGWARFFGYKHNPEKLRLVPLYRTIINSGWQWIGAADCCIPGNNQADDSFIVRALIAPRESACSGRSLRVAVGGMDGAYARPIRRLVERCEIPERSAAQVSFVLVADAWRRQGIARTLLQACTERWNLVGYTGPMSPEGDALLRTCTGYFDEIDDD